MLEVEKAGAIPSGSSPVWQSMILPPHCQVSGQIMVLGPLMDRARADISSWLTSLLSGATTRRVSGLSAALVSCVNLYWNPYLCTKDRCARAGIILAMHAKRRKQLLLSASRA